MAWDARGDIIVLLPGITGSILERDGTDVFGLTLGAGLNALFSGGRSLTDLALTADPVDEPDLGDGVHATRVAPDAHLVPGLWKIDGYGAVGAFLRTKLSLDDVDYREFPYDWRRDNRVAAAALRRESERWLHERRRTHPDARLVLLAHSMGGLVARYFLEVLGGWRDTRTLVTFGTPHRGSLNALGYLVHGYRKLFGLVDLTDLMRSFTSVHQLLPIYPCVSVDGGPLLRPCELPAGIPGLDPERARAADAFHREIESAVARNLDDERYRDHGYSLYPVVGTEHRTWQSADWRDNMLTLRAAYPGDGDMGGDGTVPSVSATPVERPDDAASWSSGTRHASLQNAGHVLTQIRHVLTAPGRNLGRFRNGPPRKVALDLDDVYPSGDPATVTLRPTVPGHDLHVTVENLTTPTAPTAIPVPLAPAEVTLTLPGLTPGCHRLTVGGDKVDPVTDLFVVAPPDGR